MKVQIILFSLMTICFSCTQNEEYVPDCVCTDLKVISANPNVQQEGIIIFPKPGFKTMYALKPDTSIDIWGGGLYSICTDSAFSKQIYDKQIKDSSLVVLKGIGYGTYGTCNVNIQRTVIINTTYNPGVDFATTLRVKTIDKK
jgi:hypothetical protein